MQHETTPTIGADERTRCDERLGLSLADSTGRWDQAEADGAVSRLAAAFDRAMLHDRPGRVVVTHIGLDRRYPAALLAGELLGDVVVPAARWWPAAELRALLHRLQPDLVVTDDPTFVAPTCPTLLLPEREAVMALPAGRPTEQALWHERRRERDRAVTGRAVTGRAERSPQPLGATQVGAARSPRHVVLCGEPSLELTTAALDIARTAGNATLHIAPHGETVLGEVVVGDAATISDLVLAVDRGDGSFADLQGLVVSGALAPQAAAALARRAPHVAVQLVDASPLAPSAFAA